MVVTVVDTNNNVNESASVIVSLKPNINNNDNERFNSSVRAETIANSLVEKFRAKGSFEFYCKIAYMLPEHKIWLNYEKATTGKNVSNPAGLFNWLCRRDMK